MQRVYFDVPTIFRIFGFDIEFYSTGNVCAASLNGEKISNHRAKKIQETLESGSLFYDVKKSRFIWKKPERSTCKDAKMVVNQFIEVMSGEL